jgi:hypothetical protein
MPIKQRALNIIALTLAAIFTTHTFAADNAPAPPPTSQPATTAPATTKPDPDFERGRARAKKDLQAGIVAEILPVPEVFLLEWQDSESEDHNLLDYYKAVLADKYNIKSDYVMFNSASPGQRMWALGYNHEMRPEIEKRCGVATLKQIWKDACNLPTADRTKYLKDHAAKSAKPASQPAAPDKPQH